MTQDRAGSGKSTRGPTSGQWSAEVSRALREALEGYCTPEMGATIVQTALAHAELLIPPETPAELSEFVTTALSPEVERRLGDDAATDLEQRMAVMIHVLSRAARAQPEVGGDDEYGPEPVSETRPLPIEATPLADRPTRPPAPVVPLARTSDRPTKPPVPSATAPSDRPTSPPQALAPSDRPTRPPEPSGGPASDRPTRPPEAPASGHERPTRPPDDDPVLEFDFEALDVALGSHGSSEPPVPVPAAPTPIDMTPAVGWAPPPLGAVTVSSDAGRSLDVAVVTPDSKMIGRVRAALGSSGQAFGYRSLADLARAEPQTLHAVLVDRRGSAPSSALVLPETVRGAEIVLWPAKPEAAATLAKTAPHVASVVSYGPEVGVEDMIVLLRVSAARR